MRRLEKGPVSAKLVVLKAEGAAGGALPSSSLQPCLDR